MKNSSLFFSRLLLSLSAALLLAFSSAEAAAAPQAASARRTPAMTATVDLVETAPSGKTKTSHFSVAGLDDSSPAELSAHVDGIDYRVRVKRTKGSQPITELELTGVRKGVGTVLEVSSRVDTPSGVRVMLGRIEHPDGRVSEVALTVR